MATAATIINRALRLLGAISSGASADTDEMADGLIALNAMIDSWNNERLMIYAIQDESLTLVDGQASYTIGTSGNLNTTRPVTIEGAYVRASSLDYTVRILNEQEYADIAAKSSESDIPEYCYYKPAMTSSQGVLYVYPVPTSANVMHLLTRTPFTAFASSATTVTLPPGYEQALAYNLAISIAPEYQVEPSASVVRMANTSLAGIKKTNSRPVKLYTELPALVGSGRSNIITDQP